VTGDVRDLLRTLPSRQLGAGDSYADLPHHFPLLHRVVEVVQPRSVFEFGAFLGYFLVTALAASPAVGRVAWVDNESAYGGSNQVVHGNVVGACGYEGRTDFLTESWQLLDREWQNRVAFQLVHVDGAHDREGCLRDLWLAQTVLAPQLILVDDYFRAGCPDVGPAVRDFAGWRGLELAVLETDGGTAILERGHRLIDRLVDAGLPVREPRGHESYHLWPAPKGAR
jgi:predicted O-methyltransferase YrrM